MATLDQYQQPILTASTQTNWKHFGHSPTCSTESPRVSLHTVGGYIGGDAVRTGRRVGTSSAAGFAEVAAAFRAGADLDPVVAKGEPELLAEGAIVFTPIGDDGTE